MGTQDGGYYDEAVAALAERSYERAGDAYARAGWRVLSEPRPEQGPFESGEKGWAGRGVGYLVTSAVCYRVAGRADRATNRGTSAAAVAADLETALDHPAQRACLDELIADARLAAGDDGARAAYDRAAESYRGAANAVDDAQYWGTTPLFQAAAEPIKQVARSQANGEIAITWEDLHGADPSTPGRFLASRAKTKRQQFPSLLSSVVDEGYLAAPRGTTEYNNATYRCPNCGSDDVNWVGDSVLCMRCSTPTESE